jgi:sugar lactone lactonase YvrE
MRSHINRVGLIPVTAVISIIMIAGMAARGQSNPYHLVENWAKLPEGRKFGAVIGVAVDRGGNIWAFDRCGGDSCAGSKLAPILKFDSSGKLVNSFGTGMFVFPHGFSVDKDGNVWAADGEGKDGKGHQVFKFSSDGKVLLTLGKAGVAGDSENTFNRPSAVVVASNGNIFVADGHGGDSNARIVKFSKDGRFLKAWGKKGSGPGEFAELHAIAIDSKGRLFVGDRGNSRIQIFDQEGKFLAEWKQFGRPSGIFIDAHDTMYVTDSQSDEKTNPGFQRGIRIGSTQDGSVRSLIPSPAPAGKPTPEAIAAYGPGDPRLQVLIRGATTEGIAADASGNIYGGEANSMNLRKYAKN